MMRLIIFAVGAVGVKLYWYKGRCNLSGAKIQQLRTEMGISQEQLAAKLQLMGIEISQNSISRIECGKRVVPDFELKYFAEFFKKPVEWFLAE